MKSYYVKDLQKGMIITGETFAVQSAEQGQTRDGKPFYKLVLSDKTGQIKGQLWSDNFANIEKGALTVGEIVMVDGIVDEYKGMLQLGISKVNKVDEATVDDYIEGSDFDLDDLWARLESYINDMQDKDLQAMLKTIFADEEISRRFKTYPAAEFVHHSFRGGLLEHVVEMLTISDSLKDFYKEANFDYVHTGIILHDIGKLFELKPVGVAIERTKEGYLLGHLVMSFETVNKYGKDLPAEKLLNIKHIVLSHHGILEYGSPVIPATIEAAIVHQVDAMSSTTRTYQKVIRQSKENGSEFAEWDRILGTKVYLGENLTPEIIG